MSCYPLRLLLLYLLPLSSHLFFAARCGFYWWCLTRAPLAQAGQDLIMYLQMTLNCWPTCSHYLNARARAMCHHAQTFILPSPHWLNKLSSGKELKMSYNTTIKPSVCDTAVDCTLTAVLCISFICLAFHCLNLIKIFSQVFISPIVM